MTQTAVIVILIVGIAAFVELVVFVIAIRLHVRKNAAVRVELFEHFEKMEQYASDAHDTRDEMERLMTRVADAVEEIAEQGRG